MVGRSNRLHDLGKQNQGLRGISILELIQGLCIHLQRGKQKVQCIAKQHQGEYVLPFFLIQYNLIDFREVSRAIPF